MVGKGEESWIVRDANGDEEVCPRDDIITDHDDASILIKVTHFKKIIFITLCHKILILTLMNIHVYGVGW